VNNEYQRVSQERWN